MQISAKLAYSLLFASGFRGEESKVLELTESTFEAATTKHGLLMTEYYVPWCSHCQRLAPEYEKAAELLVGTDIKLSKVNCDEHKDFCKAQGADGYPSLKVYRGGMPTNYPSMREANAIVGYLKKAAVPAVSFVETSNLDSFINYDRVVVMGFFDDDSDLANPFHDMADANREKYVFGNCNDKEAAKAHGVPFPGVALFKQYDERKAIHDGDHSLDSLTKFVTDAAKPVIDDMDPLNYQEILNARMPIAYIFVTSDEERDLYNEKLNQLARRAKDIKFVFVNSNLYGQHAETVGLRTQFPTFGIQLFDPESNDPIDQTKPLSPQAIFDHLQQHLEKNPSYSFNLDGLAISESEPSSQEPDEL